MDSFRGLVWGSEMEGHEEDLDQRIPEVKSRLGFPDSRSDQYGPQSRNVLRGQTGKED